MTAIPVHTKERGSAPSSLPRTPRSLDTISLDVVIPPPSPLRVGARVVIHSLTGCSPQGARGQAEYNAERTGVEGPIVGVRSMELAVTEFIVKNDNLNSTTNYAYLTIQHRQGVTVQLEAWRWVWRTLSLPFLHHTRHVPLDHEAVITPREYNIERALENRVDRREDGA
ncbi:uncharacterized protein TRAVEDRAFT_44059 [Trametes versicolor FP-101664 SS1]|uniref:uncharacterized protein n=1 Tax=Trametes versicolor (strain FP-101664) TaxID=717944 RepID=UPI00046244D8|nr:uncharacterized protein TRAVEDRAFT_44059 [Trametes versicolor FP-101664 SS1]EIW61238.1 hypothetical protein TRAVEDRAFT_44059 [Trametes versicolor FP-101664 SS1]